MCRRLLTLISCGGMCVGHTGYAQPRDSLAGETAAEALKRSFATEAYNLQYGPVRYRTGVHVGVSYTDNVFHSHDRKEDVLIKPETTLSALWRITELNALRLSVGLGYEWYLENQELNGDAPLVNPGSELTFNLFAGDFHIQFHERFSYQESLFFNSLSGQNARFYNLNDAGKFSRLNNEAGFQADWDLNEVVLSAGYNHEDFISTTGTFDYLDRASEWFNASARLALGDAVGAGVESQAGWHNYRRETRLNDNWRVRVGPFVEATLPGNLSLRAGGGFQMARYDAAAPGNNDFDSYYGYASLNQDTRLFTHALTAGREHLLGDNANNLKNTYARYSIHSPLIDHFDVGADVSVNFAEEFGGDFAEDYTYYGAGARVGAQFHEYWRADLGYEFRLKESDLAFRDFHRNRLTVSVTCSF